MSIYKKAINKPVTTILVFVAVIVIGLFSLTRLPVEWFPEMDAPFVTVLTTYPGANANEVETSVTKLVENSLNSVDGLKKVTSTSKDNISVVMLEMEWGTDLDEVMNDIRSAVDLFKDNLPKGSSSPFIFRFNSSAMPIIAYAITAEASYPGLDKILNNDLIPRLNRVDGIGNISMSGSPKRYVYVDLDQGKLDAYGLTVEAVGSAINGNNINLSAGTVKMEKEQYQLQIRSEYIESSEISNVVVKTTPAGKQVFVRDLATIRDTIKDITLDEKINSREGVRLIVTKQSGANTVEICKGLRKEIAKVKEILPSDVKIDVIFDSSEEIENSINSLKESILYALFFVVFVVFIFLGKWRATFIIGLTIPIALIVAFIYLMFIGSSLNIISLCSLTVAIGMVVDDAIVVLENISKHIDRGSNPREAAIYATNEVWISVIATTLVIVAVFVPLTMLKGMAGIMFKELGWIVSIVVCTSTVVAISLTPMLCSKLLKAKKVRIDDNGHIAEIPPKMDWYQKYIVGTFDKIDRWYSDLLRYCLHHKLITLLSALLIFGLSLIPLISGKIGTDFMQQTDNGRLNVSVELQRGNRIEETLRIARILENRFRQIIPEIVMISTSAGTNDNAGFSAIFNSTTNNKISMTVVCSKKYNRKRSIFDIAEDLRQELSNYPEIVSYQCAVASGMGMSGSSTLDVEIYGYDFDQTNIIAENIRNRIKDKVKGARDIKISREKDRPELKIEINKEKAAYSGLNSTMISGYIRNRINGMHSGFLKEEGDEYNILVRLKQENRSTINDIRNMTVPTPSGKMIKLGEIANINEHWTPPAIERKSRQRIVKVGITPYKVSLGDLAKEVQEAIKDMRVPNGVTIGIAGDYENQQETFSDMGLLLALILLLVYIVMASQFESFTKPAIIMMSVPFAVTGVILALWITGTTLDMIGALGCIMLVGIVVKNGIVLVDYINLMRDRNYELNEAIALSGSSRLRPVLMTAMTTVLGMVPMSLSSGEGSEMWRPMGIVVIGGLLVSTFVTLIVVPVVYAALSRHGERNKREKERKDFIFMQLSADDK